MTATVAERRVKKELQKLRKDPLDGISVEVGSNSSEWFVEIVGAVDTVYAGETYRLRIRFPTNYPIEAPEVVFVPPGADDSERMSEYSLDAVELHVQGKADRQRPVREEDRPRLAKDHHLGLPRRHRLMSVNSAVGVATCQHFKAQVDTRTLQLFPFVFLRGVASGRAGGVIMSAWRGFVPVVKGMRQGSCSQILYGGWGLWGGAVGGNVRNSPSSKGRSRGAPFAARSSLVSCVSRMDQRNEERIWYTHALTWDR